MLNVARMCGNREVRYAQKVPGGDSCYLKTVEVLSAHLLEDALQCRTQAVCLNGTESAGPDFVRHEKRVPPGCVYLPVKRKSIQRPNHAPVRQIGIALQFQALVNGAAVSNQNGANLNAQSHGSLSVCTSA